MAAPAAPDLTADGCFSAALLACALMTTLPVAIFAATNFSTPSSHRRRKLVEIDVFGLDSIDLQNRQDGVDHRRRAAGVGVDRTRQLFLAQMTRHHLVHETDLAIPVVFGRRV